MWEVWRALKRLELHSAVPRATLMSLSCSSNFLSAQYLDIRTLTHELIIIVKYGQQTCAISHEEFAHVISTLHNVMDSR